MTLLSFYAAREGQRAATAASFSGARTRLVRIAGQGEPSVAPPAKKEAGPSVIAGIQRMVKLGTALTCVAYYYYGQTCHESVVLKFAKAAPADPAKNVTLTCGGERVFSRAPVDVVEDALEVRVTRGAVDCAGVRGRRRGVESEGDEGRSPVLG